MANPPSTTNYKYTYKAFTLLLEKESLKQAEFNAILRELDSVSIDEIQLNKQIEKQIKDYELNFSLERVQALKSQLISKKRQKEQVPKEILQILKNPNLLHLIDREFDKRIVREFEARKVIFLVTNMRNVANLNKGSDNLIVNAISGTGKDHVSESVFEILPQNEKEELVKTTPKVLSYTRNIRTDPTATWKKTSLRLEDVSKNVVNDDSFKVFLSANPNKINRGKTLIKQKVIDIEIDGKPSLILTIANPDIKDENLRRLPMLFLDEGVDQTKEILRRQANYAKKGISIDYEESLVSALSHLKRIKVSIPYANKLTQIFEKSAQNVMVRTAFPRFLDYIKSSAALFQYQRQIDKDGCVIANEEDYDNAALCLRKTTTNLLMIPLSKLDKSLYEFFALNKIVGKSIEDLMDFEDIQRLGKTDRWIRFRLDFLTSKGFIMRHSEKVENSFKPVNKYSYKQVGDFQIPKFKELNKRKLTSNTSKATNHSNTSISSNTNKENELFEANETLLNKTKSENNSIYKKILALFKKNKKLNMQDLVYSFTNLGSKEKEVQSAIDLGIQRGDWFESKAGFIKRLE